MLQLTPQSLKPAVAKALVELMAPIQESFQASAEWQETMLKAYPPPEKKQKKVKSKGTKHPLRPKEGETAETIPAEPTQAKQPEEPNPSDEPKPSE